MLYEVITHRMGEGQARQAQGFMRTLLDARIEPVWTADDEGHVVTGGQPVFESPGQFDGGRVLAVLVQYHAMAARGQGGSYNFV